MRNALRLAVLASILLIAGWGLRRLVRSPLEELSGEAALKAWDEGRIDEADRLAREALKQRADSPEALLIVAGTAMSRQRPVEAMNALRRFPIEARPEAAGSGVVWGKAGELALQLGDAALAERLLRVAVDCEVVGAETLLAHLLGVEGQTWEASELLCRAIRYGNFVVDHLILLAASEPVVQDAGLVRRCLEADPDNPLPLLGEARTAFGDKRYADAEPVLRRVIAFRPDQLDARAWLGHLLLSTSSPEWDEWLAGLPEEISHPEVWVVLARKMQLEERPREAARCYAEAVSLDPNHRPACYQLGLLLKSLGEAGEARRLLERADRLEELAFLVDRIHADPDSASMAREAALLTERLGRPWEAAAWARLAAQRDPGSAIGREIQQRTTAAISTNPPRTLPEAVPLWKVDLSRWPRPVRSVATNGTGSPADRVPAKLDPSRPPVRFRDVAGESGVRFTYDSGRVSDSQPQKMGETLGGGVGAADFDRDGWTDLFFTQGKPLGGLPEAISRRDTLFRQSGGEGSGRFVDVTSRALPEEADYGQGCSFGDLDNDGFPDLYVANLGRNRLYRNLGDGTFDEITESAGLAGERWTSSCLIADLNGDGNPDLYDVTYLDVSVAPLTLCQRGDEVRICGPSAFQAEPDRLFQSLGEGRFGEVSSESAIDVPDGKGLGIIAADFSTATSGDAQRSPRFPNLFIANDAVPNFYFVNETTSPGAEPRFSEQGLSMGLALDASGLSLACMGVAAGDADGDGRIDLFITNYAQQANTLYRQDELGMFTDVAQQAGLVEPSWKELGFGTQFLDADFDGRLDLVLTNGHVHDLSTTGEEYRMRPQLFRNEGGLRFQERFADEIGEFFGGRYLGRGLARLDWNRDAREDFVVSHIDAPVALVSNESPPRGHFIGLQFSGTVASRDAIAAVATVRCGDRTWTRHLTGGDGFQASNEKLLVFWIGEASKVDELEIRWPGGATQRFSSLVADRRYLAIEGQPALWAIGHGQ